MLAGTLLLILADLVDLLKRKSILLANGAFDDTKVDTLEEDLSLATDIEDILKAHGLNVPGRVDKVIQILPLVASIVR